MAFLSIDDAEFWGRVPEEFRLIAGEGSMDGISISVYELGKAADNAPVMTALRMAPGYVLPRHAHDCYRLEIVMQGSIDVGNGRILKQGAVMMSEPLTLYGPHISGHEGCVTLEIFSTHKASHTTYIEAPSGELVECDLWTVEGAKRMAENIRQQEASLRS
jgi:hypothetical protein